MPATRAASAVSAGGLGGLRAQAGDQGVVEAVDAVSASSSPAMVAGELVGEHQRPAPVAGNQCSSGSGSVLGGSSR